MRSFYCAALVLAMAGALPALAETYSTAGLSAELRGLETQARRGRAIDIPPAWEIDSPQGTFSISTQPLKELLAARRGADAAEWLEHLAHELDQSAGGTPAGEARGRLEEILKQREFAAMRPPSVWQLLWERILGWIGELLDRLFRVISRHPTTSQVLFWTLIGGAGCMLLLWVARLGQRERTALNIVGSAPVRPRAWAEWLQAARLAAEQGDLRQAIHCSYWAGVTRLQETGVLTADSTHTPREYLRLAEGTAPATELAALTSGLERFWYAGRRATQDDFRASLKQLEALGCRLP